MPYLLFPLYSTENEGSHKRSDTNMFEPIITHIFLRETYKNRMGRYQTKDTKNYKAICNKYAMRLRN